MVGFLVFIKLCSLTPPILPALVGLLSLTLTLPTFADAIVSTLSLQGRVPVQSWKERRDARIVKQSLDYSCGAASLATLLKEFYGYSISEEALLKTMDKGDLRASFEDMQRALPPFGFRAVGYAVSFTQLTQLKMPVVVYLRHRKDDHFSVLRGIDNNTVWLADPSLGNRTYSRAQFLDMWETRGDATLKGKILAVLPVSNDVIQRNDFFSTTPSRVPENATQLQIVRHLLP